MHDVILTNQSLPFFLAYMSKRDVWTGLVDEVIGGAPHSTLVSDKGLELKYAKETADALRQLSPQLRTLSPERLRSNPEILARELAPLFEGMAVSAFHGDQMVSDEIGQMRSDIGQGLRGLSEEQHRGFHRVEQGLNHLGSRVDNVGHRVDRASWTVANASADAGINTASAITGMAFNRRQLLRDIPASILNTHTEDIAILYLHGLVPKSVLERASKRGRIGGIDASRLLKSLESGAVEGSPERTWADRVRSQSLHQLIHSGRLSRQGLHVLNQASALPPTLQTSLYSNGIIEPPIWSIAGMNVGLRSLNHAASIGLRQRDRMLAAQRGTNWRLDGIQNGVQGLRSELGISNRHLASINTGVGQLHETALRSEVYLAASASSLAEISGAMDDMTMMGADIADGVRDLNLTLNSGFSSLEGLLTEVIRAEVYGAERIASQIQQEGNRQAVFLQRLVESVYTTANAVVANLEIVQGDLKRLQDISLHGVRTQIEALHELRAMREEQRNAALRMLQQDAVRNELLDEIRDGVLQSNSDKEVVSSHRRAARAERAGRSKLALRIYEKALEHDPTHAESHFQIGRVHLKSGDQAKAKSQFEEAVIFAENTPRKATYLLYLGLCTMSTSETEGIKLLEEAKIYSPDIHILLVKALVQWRIGKKKEAKDILKHVILTDARVIHVILSKPTFIEIRPVLIDEILKPILLENDDLSPATLYHISQLFLSIETHNYPPRLLKAVLKKKWKVQLKKALTQDPLLLITNPYLSSLLTKTSRPLITEVINEVIVNNLPEYKTPADYYFLAALLAGSPKNHPHALRKILFKGFEHDPRTTKADSFGELLEEIQTIGGAKGQVLLKIIMNSSGRHFRQFKNYIYSKTDA